MMELAEQDSGGGGPHIETSWSKSFVVRAFPGKQHGLVAGAEFAVVDGA